MFERPRLRGASLLEVLAALVLVAGVVLSIAGLAATAGRYTAGGLHATKAVSAARGALEELHGWSFRGTHRHFGCDPDLDRCTVDGSHPVLARWLEPLRGYVVQPGAELTLSPLGSSSLRGATEMRIVLTLHWIEGPRRRRVRLITVRA